MVSAGCGVALAFITRAADAWIVQIEIDCTVDSESTTTSLSVVAE